MKKTTTLFLLACLAFFWQMGAQNSLNPLGSWQQHSPNATFGERTIFTPTSSPGVNLRPQMDDCNQITPAPPEIEDGYSNLGEVQMANDLVVAANQNFSMESLSFNSMIQAATEVESVDVYYYTDSGDGPGTLLGSQLGIAPANIENHGIVNGFDHVTISVDFDTPVAFAGNSFETIYWIGLQISIDGANAFMEITTFNMNTPNQAYVYSPSADSFLPGSVAIGGTPGDGVLSIFGTCEDLPACSGAPSAGTVQGPNEICSGIEFLLEATGATQGQTGLSYQWQKRLTGGDWEDMGGATNFRLYQNISVDTDYRFTVQCGTDTPEVSNTLSVIVKAENECYCIPEFQSGCEQFGDYIKDFILEGENGTVISDLDGECPTGAYEDSTDQSVDLIAGFEYVARISSGSSSDDVAVWIDFNNNGYFEMDEVVGTVRGVDGNQKNLTLNVPADAPEGHFRMRVFMHYWELPTDPCVPAAPWGMVRDYSVDILSNVDCSGQPDAGVAETIETICANTAFDLSVSGVSQAVGISYHWERSPQGQNDWTIIPDSSTFNYTVSGGITEATDFRFVVACSFSGESSNSNVLSVAITAPDQCYCDAVYYQGCLYGNAINIIRFLDADGNIVFENETDCAPDQGYIDYTNLGPIDLQQGKTYTLEIITNSPEPFYEDARAWIDFAVDGVFNDEDQIANSGGEGFPDGGKISSEFTVPADQDLGNFRMRVRLQSYVGNPAINPCRKLDFGETEDYMVTVVESLSVTDVDFANFSFYPNPAQDHLNLKAIQPISDVVVYNLLGQQLLVSKPNARQAQIDIQSLSVGTYIMKVVVNGNEKSFKIVKN